MRLALAIALATARVAGAATFHAVPEVTVLVAPTNGTQMGTVSLANDGAAPLAVDSIVPDNTCDPTAVTALPLGPFTIAAHGMQAIAVGCTAQPAGMSRCTFHARDAAAQPLLDFSVACAYASATTLAASTGAIAFASSVTVGGSASQTLTLTNQGTPGQTIGKLYFEITDFEGDFTIGSPCNPDAADCNAGIAGLAAGATTPIEVECTPHTPGAHTAELYIITDSGQRLASPIELSCTGVTDPANPVILASPSLVELGAVEVIDGTGAGTVVIQNVGGGAGSLAISDIRIVDGGNGTALDWTTIASGQCSTTPCKLAAGQQMALAIGFDPSALGVRDATLLVSYTDTAARSISIPLRGTGLGATLQLVGPPAVDFGTLPIGIAQAVTLQLVNAGNRTVADVTLSGDGGAFTVAPSAVSIAHGTPAAITITCQPTALGTTTATIQAMAPDVVSGSPVSIAVTCKGGSSMLYASPSTLLLGEIRLGDMPAPRMIQLLGSTETIAAAHLALPSTNFMVVAPMLPAPAPLMLELAVTPMLETATSPLATLVVTPGSGEDLAIPVSGSVVSASYAVPPIAALGTYCIGQPTTSSTVTLTSTGTATLALQTPLLQAGNASPFELALISPTLYPELLAPQHGATIAVTPDRQTTAGTQMDNLIWTTDVAGMTTAQTKVTAEFVDSGGAIAPAALGFGNVPIHTMTPGQRVTVQNCNNSATLRLDVPHVPLPFSLDTPGDFPRTLMPNETVSFSVSFSPLMTGPFAATITITSETLTMPLSVALAGIGITDPIDVDAGIPIAPPGTTSFYACGCTGPGAPIHGWPVVLAMLVVVRRRRR